MIKKCIVVSANGYGNIGDDVCGLTAQHIIKSLSPTTETVLTQPPFNASLLEGADALIIGGGGLLYDGSIENVSNYMDYVDAMKAQGGLVFVLGVGEQGITSRAGIERYKKSLGSVDILTVRSLADKQRLDELGIEGSVATQDLGFMADDWITTPGFFEKVGIKARQSMSKPKLGLVPVDLVRIQGEGFDDQSKNIMDSIEHNIPQLMRYFDVHLLLHSHDDREYYQRLVGTHGVKMVDYCDINAVKATRYAYSGMDLIVASRFHAIVFGMLAHVPTIGVFKEGSKHDKLATHDVPTYMAQSYRFAQKERIKDLFANLADMYRAGQFSALSDDELRKLKECAYRNRTLLEPYIS